MNTVAAKKIAQTSPDVVWFVARGNVLKGPYTTPQLLEKIHKRELSFFDFCWRQGFKEWRPVAAVEDFERRNRVRHVPTYPTVEVPTGPSAREDENVIPITRGRQNKTVQVNFAKMRRHSITAYEWAAALIFSVCLAYFSSSFALNEVQSTILKRLAVMGLGKAQKFGENEAPVPPEVWAPLYSAPGFPSDGVTAPPLGYLQSDYQGMPVTVQGQPYTDESGKMFVENFRVDASSKLPLWRSSEQGLDPVYSRTVEIKGYLSPKDGGVVLTNEPGDPSLRFAP